MGVEFRAIVLATDPDLAEAALAAGWEKVDQLDQLLSDYREDSAAMLLARSAPHDGMVTVEPDLWRILELSREISDRTAGSFDVTVGPASHLWRNAIKRNRLPLEDEIGAVRQRIGWQQIQTGPGHLVSLKGTDMILDFGGIAQGYAADAMLGVLREYGIQSALVDASGDIAVFGSADESGGPWRISLPGPESGRGAEIELWDGGVATSGGTTQYLEVDGVRYSHIVDPRTARAVTTARLVTVKAGSAAMADALATAFSILPEEESRRIAESWPGVTLWVGSEPVPCDDPPPGTDGAGLKDEKAN
jgi:FAD:protein FMN transferase